MSNLTIISALAKLGTSPLERDRLWIADSRISHAGDTPDNKLGEIEWMKFIVEIKLPLRKGGADSGRNGIHE